MVFLTAHGLPAAALEFPAAKEPKSAQQPEHSADKSSADKRGASDADMREISRFVADALAGNRDKLKAETLPKSRRPTDCMPIGKASDAKAAPANATDAKTPAKPEPSAPQPASATGKAQDPQTR